jgi:NAD(P)-dependent dehydrogenase (short-subunit alcohol dehydrogenase family)
MSEGGFEMNRVKDKVAIVTGAGTGIGEASACLLAKEGAKVVVADIDIANGESVAKRIIKEGGNGLFVKHDVASEDSWKNVIRNTLDKYGKIDVLVNNAGVTVNKDIEQTTLEEWRWLMSINLDGVFLGIKHIIPPMKEGGGGSIVNICSAAGNVGQLWAGAYCASKGGVRLLTKAAALECSKMGHDYNIRVNSIHPGCTKTSLIERLCENENMKKIIYGLHPVGYLAEPIDIAYAVLYLASDESRFATGSELVIDGGYTAQ